MLALVYILVISVVGDLICRRFFSYISIQHRLATAFLSGLLFSSCFTYLATLLFSGAASPLSWSNLVFFATATLLITWLRHGSRMEQPGDGALLYFQRNIFPNKQQPDLINTDRNLIKFSSEGRPAGSLKWDLICLFVCLTLGVWLMFATLNFVDGNFHFSVKSWSDFGPNLSLAQSFAWGHNFPTEHPFYPGETIRYHFLFWFQAANLSFLGLNLVWAINLLSILSLMALLALMMTFAELLFNSRAVGRIAAVLFFFSASSLSYIPFLHAQSGIGGAITSILNAKDFLKSGYSFRGDDWGALTVAVFSNQRHLIAAVGILFIVLIFLVDFYRRNGAIDIPGDNESNRPVNNLETSTDIGQIETDDDAAITTESSDATVDPALTKHSRNDIHTLLFCGLLIGALPYWNSAVFVSAAIVLGGFLAIFPQRRYLAVMIGAIILVGLPQVLMLRSGDIAPSTHGLFHWGYTIPDPTFPLVFEYLAWTFGLKWILIFMALVFLPAGHRRLFLVFLLLVTVAFTLQLSTDAFNNHKLLNIWNIFAVIYAAYALWVIGKANVYRAALAVMLATAMVFGSVIDLFPLHNDSSIVVPHNNDRLTNWLFKETKPTDIFLTDKLLSHPILFTGRKVFLGNTLYAYTAGYAVKERETTYQNIFIERDLLRLVQLLRENQIAYVAIDDGVRRNTSISGFNETIYRQHFETVFEDIERRYGNLTIYRVP